MSTEPPRWGPDRQEFDPANKDFHVIRVDPHKCDGCGICVYDCGADVFRFTNKKDKVFPFGNKYCVNCFLCELVCPEDAIEVVLRPKKRKAAAAAETNPSSDT